MKRIIVTAAALMLGTSALAWAPAEKAHLAGTDAAKVETASKAALSGAKGLSMPGKGLVEAASPDKAASSMARFVESDGKVEMAAVEPAKLMKSDEGKVQTAALAMSKDVGGVAEVQTAAWSGKDAKVETASWSDVKEVTLASSGKEEAYTGMGGPEVTAEGYPPCDPGPGDDRCIQLYERGVAQAAAAWKGSDSVGMGGPYEPAPATGKEHADHQAGMSHGSGSHSGHGSSDSAPAENDAGAKPAASTADVGKDDAVTAAPVPGAIGGPYVASTDYPPCRPGRGDDRCIQLYERGVANRRK